MIQAGGTRAVVRRRARGSTAAPACFRLLLRICSNVTCVLRSKHSQLPGEGRQRQLQWCSSSSSSCREKGRRPLAACFISSESGADICHCRVVPLRRAQRSQLDCDRLEAIAEAGRSRWACPEPARFRSHALPPAAFLPATCMSAGSGVPGEEVGAARVRTVGCCRRRCWSGACVHRSAPCSSLPCRHSAPLVSGRSGRWLS